MTKTHTSTLKWLYAIPGKKRGYIYLLTLIEMATGGVGALFALLLQKLVDSAVNGDMDAFWQHAVLLILLTAGDVLLSALARWLRELAKASIENILKLRLANCLLRKDYAAVNAVHSGEWMNRLTNDTAVVSAGYVEILPEAGGTLVRLVSAFVVLFMLERLFLLILIPGGILLFVVISLFRKAMKRLHKRVQEKDGQVRIFLQERISSLMMIKSFAAEEKTSRDALRYMREHKDARMRKNDFNNLSNTGFSAALEGLYVFGAVYCGWRILQGTMSFGTLAAVMQLVNQVKSPLVNISAFLPKYFAMQASAERLMEAEAFPDDLQGRLLSQQEIRSFYETEFAGIGLRHAYYTYYPSSAGHGSQSKENMPVVLKDLTLCIRKGEYVAFTGHSGCGKSTVLKLLMCLYHLDGGRPLISCRDGKELLLTARYRRMFACVPQGNQLMNGTIREIVAFSEQGEVDENKLERSLRIACASEFIAELEHGTETQLGERGTGLSEGQMQRIAIARALYSDAPILLLDESTSALDAGTEETLLRNLRNLTDKTVIIVTHRPAALAICDRVLEFTENGVADKKPM